MKKNNMLFITLTIITIVFLLVITLVGVFSFRLGNSYDVVNPYGETIKLFGSGVYAHDSYFKAPLFIGTDFTMLVVIVPIFIFTFVKSWKEKNTENEIRCFSMFCFILYYSASLSFGVAYNYLHLIYIALFSISFYMVGLLFIKLLTASYRNPFICKYTTTKGMIVYLILSGIALFAAWLPDIISSLAHGTSLELIEVYTTEITYVLDMGIISPLMFITIYLVRKRNFIGYILFRVILKICSYMGIVLPIQSVFQLLSGIEIPIPALITKVSTFIVLALFSIYFEHKLYHSAQLMNTH